MHIESIKCDECGRTKGEGNHWHQLCVIQGQNNGPDKVTVELGFLGGFTQGKCEIHDLCGEQCFYKHIGKLLKLNPVEIDTEAPSELPSNSRHDLRGR